MPSLWSCSTGTLEWDIVTGCSIRPSVPPRLSAKAKIFVDETGIDTFAAFFGNLHGLYSTEKRLKLNVLEEIRNLLPNTFLSPSPRYKPELLLIYLS